MSDSSGPATGAGVFRLGWSDLARSAVVAVLSAALTYLYSGLLGDGTLDLGAIDWKKVGGISLAATAAYLLKNLVSDETGKVLGKIGAIALLLLVGLGLSACGTAVGSSLGLTSAGSASIKITQTQFGCPDAEAQGAVPLNGFEAACIYDPASNRSSQTIKVQSSDPTQLITDNNKLLAGVVSTLAGAAAGGPLGGAAGGLVGGLAAGLTNGSALSPSLGQAPGGVPTALIPPTP